MFERIAIALLLTVVTTSARALDPSQQTTESGRALGRELVPALAQVLAAYRTVRDETKTLVVEMGSVDVVILRRDRPQAALAVHALQARFRGAMAMLDAAVAAQKTLAAIGTRVSNRGFSLGERVFGGTATPAEKAEASDLVRLDIALHEDPDYREAIQLDGLIFAYMDYSLHLINIVQRAKALEDGKLDPLGGPKTPAERDALLKKIQEPWTPPNGEK